MNTNRKVMMGEVNKNGILQKSASLIDISYASCYNEEEKMSFVLKKDNTIRRGLAQLLEDEFSMTDVTLACEGQFIQAHKVVLAVSSPFFKEYFKTYCDMDKAKDLLIVLTNMKFDHLQALIHFIYHGEVSIKRSELSIILQTARDLKIDVLDAQWGLERDANRLSDQIRSKKVRFSTLMEHYNNDVRQTGLFRSQSTSSILQQCMDLNAAKKHQSDSSDTNNNLRTNNPSPSAPRSFQSLIPRRNSPPVASKKHPDNCLCKSLFKSDGNGRVNHKPPHIGRATLPASLKYGYRKTGFF